MHLFSLGGRPVFALIIITLILPLPPGGTDRSGDRRGATAAPRCSLRLANDRLSAPFHPLTYTASLEMMVEYPALCTKFSRQSTPGWNDLWLIYPTTTAAAAMGR